MDDRLQENKGCGPAKDSACACSSQKEIGLQPPFTDITRDEVCCGSPPGPESNFFERPGYVLLQFVEDFVETPIGPVPRIKTRLDRRDMLGRIAVRWAINRKNYKVAPGLYCVGAPDQDSPVLVTANYKLTFDLLRRQLACISAWIIVLDTRGINVWCAAGKNLFSTNEVVRRVKLTGLGKIVRHRQLILPQLAATGVSAHQVKKDSNFKVVWGPIRAQDIKSFLDKGLKAEPYMRRVTFSFVERLTLIPVELSQLLKPTLWALLGIFLISGIGSPIFSFTAAWPRGLMAMVAFGAGILAGGLIAPALLPWIPMRPFALKGAVTGFICGIGVVFIFEAALQFWEALALILGTTAIGSYLAMNFTGSTPFTSPSGVEKEMRKAIPLQVCAILIAVGAWIASAFAK